MQFMLLLVSVIGTIAAQVTFDVSLSTDCSTPAVGSVVLPDNFVCVQSGQAPRYTRESTCVNMRTCLQNLYSGKTSADVNETLSCLYDELYPTIEEAHYVNVSSGPTFTYYSFFGSPPPISCGGQSFDFEATTVSSTCSVMPTQERPAVPCISFAVQGTLPNATTSTTTGGDGGDGGDGDGTTSGGDGGDNSSAAAVIEYIY